MTPQAQVAYDSVQKSVQASDRAKIEFLIETIASNLHLHAVQVVTIAASVSAATRSDDQTLLRSCRHLLHDNGKAMLLALKFGAEIGLAPSLVIRLNDLYSNVVSGKPALAALVDGSASRQWQEALKTQAAWWRRAAGETQKAIDLFDEAARGRLGPVYAEDTRAIRSALQKAADGDASLIDSSGSLVLPKLRQRRQSPRLAVDRTCTLHLPSGAVQARIEDISPEGLGVVCPQPLTAKQELKITLDNGTQVDAVVVRVQGSVYGLSLRKPLAQSDILSATPH